MVYQHIDDNNLNENNISTLSKQGKLKIFFGYAAGVGKTYAMLEAAHYEVSKGKDVIVGYIQPNKHLATHSLAAGLEQAPIREIEYTGVLQKEFDLDYALKRMPDLILVDEFAHTNVYGMRHEKRYQDIEELLNAGIDVYTTMNVQNLESLNDVVEDITGKSVRERIPDYLFDTAESIELVDIEPEELKNRLKYLADHSQENADETLTNSFTKEKLTALRELALRRTADQVNNKREFERYKEDYEKSINEVVLTCISSSKSNQTVIRSASRLAKAFNGQLIALYVETPNSSKMLAIEKENLKKNMKLAEDFGATITTVYGDDVAAQISEFAKVSGVSKIVLGRSFQRQGRLIHRARLVDHITKSSPNTDIFIIPDQGEIKKRQKRRNDVSIRSYFREFMKSIGILLITSLISLVLAEMNISEENILATYFLGTIVAAVVVRGIWYNTIVSILAVVLYSYLFAYPRYNIRAYDNGFMFTAILMIIVSIVVSTLTTGIQKHSKQAAIQAYHTNILLETTQKLQSARTFNEIYTTIAEEILSLFDYSLVLYPQVDGKLQQARTYSVDPSFDFYDYISSDEEAVANWVLKNNRHAGKTTRTLPSAKCLYLAIRGNDEVYGVIGIIPPKGSIDINEKNLLVALLAECGMSLDKVRSIQRYNEISQQAKQEELRYTLLRSISHDLRTPLTGISGNIKMLIDNSEQLSSDKIMEIYEDVYEDSNWLISLTENLLSITRIENNQVPIQLKNELVDDLVEEALRHIKKKSTMHVINYQSETPYAFIDVDVRLFVQVIVNLIDNAIKYSPVGSTITVSTRQEVNQVFISVSDEGIGLLDVEKDKIFELFYTASNETGDSRKSLGLGLYLCKMIITEHHGTIRVLNNKPKGTTFEIQMKVSEEEDGNISN